MLAASWSADDPAWKFAPAVFFTWPVRNDPLARAWSPAPSPLGRALSHVSPPKTIMSLRYSAIGSRQAGSSKFAPSFFGIQ